MTKWIAVIAKVLLAACGAVLDTPDDAGAADSGSSDGGINTAEPANYALEITFPRPAGPAPGGLTGSNRALVAYPEMAYDIQVGAIGGSFPYRYDLDGEPAGMTIDGGGVVSWPAPTQGADGITVHVTDALGTTTSIKWSIAVDATRFKFVDPVNGASGNDGSREQPWRTLADVYASVGPKDIVYLRAGTYDLAGLPISNSGDDQLIDWNVRDGRGTQFLAYPGDSRPVIDFGYAGTPRPRIWFQSNAIYFDGIEVRNTYTIGFQLARTEGQGAVFRRCVFAHGGPGIDGLNSAFVMFQRGRSWGDMIVDSEFSDTPAGPDGNIALKVYDSTKLLVARSAFHGGNGSTEAWVAMKGGVEQFTFRQNHVYDIAGLGLGGNMANSDAPDFIPTSGEIAYNYFACDPTNATPGVGPVQIKGHSDALGAIRSYRNTYRGSPTVQWLATGDELVTLRHDVIISGNEGRSPWPHLLEHDVTTPSILRLMENLTGAAEDRIIDHDGKLEGAYRAEYLGRRGHEVP